MGLKIYFCLWENNIFRMMPVAETVRCYTTHEGTAPLREGWEQVPRKVP